MNKTQGGKKHITAFYMETLVLIAVFIVVILVLARVFALAGSQSGQAQRLTRAVRLAENAAEAVAAAKSGEELAALLDENGNVREQEGYGCTAYRAEYDSEMQPVADGSNGNVWVDVTWEPMVPMDPQVPMEPMVPMDPQVPIGSNGSIGTLVQSTIRVYWEDQTEPVYTLETAVYLP